MASPLIRAQAYIADRPQSARQVTAVVVGGTTGIGCSTAILLATLGCKRVIIMGRSQARADEVLAKMRDGGQGKGEAGYVQGDVSTIKGMQTAATDLGKAVGERGIDVLIMTQNGVPTGTIQLTEDGLDHGFAVQAVSRFALPHFLMAGGFLAPRARIVSVANCGVSLDDLEVTDLSLRKRAGAGRGKTGLFMDQSKRDSSVLDAFIMEHNARYPEYAHYHIHPGLVNTPNFNVSAFPFPFSILVRLGLMFISSTPEATANLPAYLALCEDDERNQLGKSRFFDHNLKVVEPGRWAQKEDNRKALWVELMRIIGAKE